MKIADILEKAINKELTYAEALKELKKLKLDYEDEDRYDRLLHKMLGDNKRFRDFTYFFNGLPNEKYLEVLNFAISLVREGLYSNEIAQMIYDKYMLSAPLITYFLNEAISIVRMNNITPEELAGIGEAYHIVATQMEEKGLKEKPVIQEDEINAEEIDEIDLGME
jgi:hypothetical protein